MDRALLGDPAPQGQVHPQDSRISLRSMRLNQTAEIAAAVARMERSEIRGPSAHCHLFTLASFPSTWIVACFAPDFTQVSQISSGWTGASVRHTCAPFNFQTPVTGIALSPAGVSAPDNWPPVASVMRAVKVLPPSRSEDETTSPFASSACISAAV